MMRAALVLLLASLLAAPAAAYHPSTHAGLAERAALASSLHKRLSERFHRALGLYEPLALDDDGSPARRDLDRRLATLDPEGGLVPDRGRLTAIGWLTAGAVLEAVPAGRARNHFYDPTRNRGLDQAGGEALRTRIDAANSGIGSVRGIFTGESFDGSGQPAPVWLQSPDNGWGLLRFDDELERAASAPTQPERDGALARALLAAGSILHVLQESGDPTFVRNDYRVALQDQAGPYERFVALEYGRLGVPEPDGPAVRAPSLEALFHTPDGKGLSDRTATRFFSPGTLPGMLPAGEGFALPTARAAGATYTAAGQFVSAGRANGGWATGAVPHLARWKRTERGIEWSLDERCYADYAAVLLPETARYAEGALEWLFRGRLEIDTASGAVAVTVRDTALGAGRLSVWADGGDGPRRLAGTHDVAHATEGQVLPAVALPAGTRKFAVVFRGVDGGGQPIVIVQEATIGQWAAPVDADGGPRRSAGDVGRTAGVRGRAAFDGTTSVGGGLRSPAAFAVRPPSTEQCR